MPRRPLKKAFGPAAGLAPCCGHGIPRYAPRYVLFLFFLGCFLLGQARPAEAGDSPALISTYTTWFNADLDARTQNIKVAARSLDGRIVRRGEVFSFNLATGPRSKDRGYEDAMIVVEGMATPGVGGGVCQVASTLYNAVLRAGLPVVERHPHSRPVPYVPLGTDATVSQDRLDLRFRNDLGVPIKISARVGEGCIAISLHGPPGRYREAAVVPILEDILPPPTLVLYDHRLPHGKRFLEQQGQIGYRVALWRDAGRPGVISRDVYLPVPRVIRARTGKGQD
ncbi:MAG: vancomycin resistance protein [Clostridia bacterium]|nr:MAG: vancomycin resistance protein [Clostridia bacterium]